MTTVFKVGDKVSKVAFEHRLCGEVRSIFTRANGAVRLVIEHIDDGGNSFLQICSEANLALEIDHDGWIEWSGGECPVEPNTLVDYVTICGEPALYCDCASTLRWKHLSSPCDIIAYRIHRK